MQTLHERLMRSVVERIPAAECVLRAPLFPELEEFCRKGASAPGSVDAVVETLYKEIDQRLRRIRILKGNFNDFEEEFVQKVVSAFLRGELDKLDKQICQKEIAVKVDNLMRGLAARSDTLSSTHRDGLTAVTESARKSGMLAAVFAKAMSAPFTPAYFENFDTKVAEAGRSSVIGAIAQRSKLKTGKAPELETFVSLIRHPRVREIAVTPAGEATRVQLQDLQGHTFAALECTANAVRLVAPDRPLWRQSVESINASLSLSFLAKVKEAIHFCIRAHTDAAKQAPLAEQN